MFNKFLAYLFAKQNDKMSLSAAICNCLIVVVVEVYC